MGRSKRVLQDGKDLIIYTFVIPSCITGEAQEPGERKLIVVGRTYRLSHGPVDLEELLASFLKFPD